MMFFSILRFAAKGWIYDLYVKPQFFFAYPGFEWLKPLGASGMYFVFAALALSFLMVMLGLFYRVSSVAAFLLFTYVELLDRSNYLNHYYFISIVSFLLCFLPAHRFFSLDVKRKPSLKITHIPFWMTAAIKLQLGMVYFFAGVAKINYDWLFNAFRRRVKMALRGLIRLGGRIREILAWRMVRVVLSLTNAVIALKPGHNVYSAGGGITQTKAKDP